MRKIFTFLLALVASVGMMNAKVTWNSSNISDLKVRSYQPYSKEGVTLSSNSDMVEARWQDFGDESMDGISFNANATGGFTFSNTLSKNFTKIQMTLTGPGGWDMANLGNGWSFYWNPMEDKPATVTWTGNAATVDLAKDASNFNGEKVKSIVFYFVGDSEAPDPTYTVALKAGTANADKVKLSATSAIEGKTITVTPNEEYEITAFNAYYVVVEDQLGTIYNIDATLDPGTGAYSFTMPAANVTIEATIALKPVYTVALQDGTVNADKVKLSATSAVEGKTITVTPNEEYEIKAFKATYNTTEELSTSFNAETGAYSFTMPAYAVTIEATIALKPVPEGDIFAGFTATAGSGGYDNEGHANLVDNKFISSNWTKWCANDGHKSIPTGESESCWWIDFEASAALNPTGYILTTGNDTGSEHGRNPKNWLLKAKLNAGDAWTTIATVTDDVTMKNQSFKDYKFFVDLSGTYQYFRFEVFANQGANVMQLCELRLIGTEPVLVTTHTLQLHVNDAAMGSVAVTNLLGSGIVDNGDGTYDVPDGAEVTILATPKEGYEFSGWKASRTICDFAECEFVDLNTVDNPLTFDMYADGAFMAEFKAVTPTAVENVQTNQVQATKILRDGQLYIMYKGTMYNVQGARVK